MATETPDNEFVKQLVYAHDAVTTWVSQTWDWIQTIAVELYHKFQNVPSENILAVMLSLAVLLIIYYKLKYISSLYRIELLKGVIQGKTAQSTLVPPTFSERPEHDHVIHLSNYTAVQLDRLIDTIDKLAESLRD